MVYPTKYSRQFDFQSYQNSNPTRPLPGDKVNADLNVVVMSIGEIVEFLKGVIRSDGKLSDGVVTASALHATAVLGFDAPALWAPSTKYVAGRSTVFHSTNVFYLCATTHVSGATFDVTKWVEVFNFGASAIASAASAASALASQNAAAASAASASASAASAFGAAQMVFATVATLGTATIPVAAQQVRVQGYYAANDGGDGYWEKKVSEPSHVAKIQSADGAWWQPKSDPFLNIKACGAKADWNVGSMTGTDNAPFIQAAADITKAEANLYGMAGGSISVPVGSFGLAGTVNFGEAAGVFGAGRGKTRFYRATNYGDTFTFALGGYARQVQIHNFEIIHSTFYDRTTNANMPCKDTLSSSHLRIDGALQAHISNLSLNRLAYQMFFLGGDNVHIHDCILYGVWDSENVNNQEGVAQIYVDTTTSRPGLARPTNWDVERVYFAGQASNTRSLTWPIPASGGAASAARSYERSIGSQYGLLMRGCENGRFNGLHCGGLSVAEVAFLPNADSVLIDVRVTDGFFDGSSHGVGILIEPTAPATTFYGYNVKIEGNTFIDQRNGIVVLTNSSGGPSVYGLSIHKNKMRNMIGTPISIAGAKGYEISHNDIDTYNRFNLSTTDTSFICGILTYSQAAVGEVFGNRIGGSLIFGNSQAVTASYPSGNGNYCWYDVLNYGAGENYNYDNNSILCTNRRAAAVPVGLR